MYQVSKRLQAVKKRLKQMQDQYISETEINRDELEKITHEPSDKESQRELCKGTLSPSPTNKELHDSADYLIMLQTPDSTVSFNDDILQVMKKCNTDDEIPLSEELRYALSTLEETNDTISTTDDVIPLSEELRCALSSLEEIDDASSNANDIHFSDELRRTLSNEEEIDDATSNRDDVKPISEDLQCTLFSLEEIDDAIERKRRYNINDRIQELATLLPETDHKGFHMNKGSILKAAVKYVKNLKKDQERLQFLETVQSKIKFKQQKMLIRIFQLELKVNLYRLSSNGIDFTKTKRGKKKSLEKIDRMVECFFQGTVSGSSSILETAEKKKSLKTHRDKNDPSNMKKGHVLQTSSSNNSCQEIHMSSRLPTLITDGHKQFYNSLTSTSDISDSDSDIECLQYSKNEVSTYRNNYYLDMAQNSTIDAPVRKISTAEYVTPHSPQDTPSPSSFQTGMLESLLRRSKIVSRQNSESSSLENSICTSSSNA